MATDTLSTTTDSAKLGEIASTVQIQAGRIKSLAEAIDSEIDAPGRDPNGRVLDYVNLLREAAERARAAGEALEVISMQPKDRGQ
jgi:hypothetical protein